MKQRTQWKKLNNMTGSRTTGWQPSAQRYLVPVCLLVLLSSSPVLSGEVTGQVVEKNGEAISQAVVFVQSLPAGVSAPTSLPVAEMDQIQKEFVPSVLPVAVGAEVRFPNHDQIRHHVYSFSRTKSFELPLYKDEQAPTVLFDKPGVIKIGCNIHDWMSAIIYVTPTPYFALSDDAGKFVLHDLPAGSYTLAAWHERSPAQIEDTAQPVQVGEQPVEVRFILALTPPRPRLAPRQRGFY